MQRNDIKHLIMSIVACLLIAAFAFVFAAPLAPKEVNANTDTRLEGIIFWGQSSMAYMYDDLLAEVYGSGGGSGTSEALSHIWCFADSIDEHGSSFTDFLNLGKFNNYWVNQSGSAQKYASLGDGMSGITQSGSFSRLSKVNDGITEALTRGWDLEHTAIVLWAGEDWVVRNADSSDIGFSTNGDPGAVARFQHEWLGLDLPPQSIEVLNRLFRSEDGSGGLATEDLDGNTVHGHWGDDVDSSTPGHLFGTGSDTSAITVTLVFNNGRMLPDYLLSNWIGDDASNPGSGHWVNTSGFSYTADQDGLDLTLQHLPGGSDAFPEGSDGATLAAQSGVAFGRVISGYSFNYEFLEQDLRQWWGDDYANLDREETLDPYWEAVYKPGFDNIVNTPTTTVVMPDGDLEGLTVNHLTSVSDPDHPELLPCDADEEVRLVFVEEVLTDAGEVTGYVYDKTVKTTYHHPAAYEWHEVVGATYHTRCDSDFAPNAGYADAWHYHEYGGMNNVYDEAGAQIDTNDDTADHYYIDASGNLVSDDTADHRADAPVAVQVWYTNLDKPIMKVGTMPYHVEGWAERWRREAHTAALKIYVFGLGPYNKSLYQDQKDERWADTVEYNNAGTVTVPLGDPSWAVNTDPDAEPDVHATPGSIDEIKRTDRVDAARQQFNMALRGATTGGAQFIDIWDMLAAQNPYYRYQNISGGMHLDGSGVGFSEAQHGKWYDASTHNWVFHTMWETARLADPPLPDDPAIDLSLYTLSSALTAYSSIVTSAAGREDDHGAQTHVTADIDAAGMAGAGAAMGYGDESYGFVSHITTTMSETASSTSYTALCSAGFDNMYAYARYGRLLTDLGLDKTGTQSIISTRAVPGAVMSLSYILNSALSFVWTLSLDFLKALNPFQFFHDATSISLEARKAMLGIEPMEDFETESRAKYLFVKMAASNPAFARIMGTVGSVYDTLSGSEQDYNEYDTFGTGARSTSRYHFTVIMLYLVLFIASVLLFWHAGNSSDTWSKAKVLLFRIAFIVVGIPLLGVEYTVVLNGVSEMTNITASPSSQMVASTFVDFSGWVRYGRLSPPSGATLVSDVEEGQDAGLASDLSVSRLRHTAWSVNRATGVLATVDMSAFMSGSGGTPSGLDDPSVWNQLALQEYNNSSDSWKTSFKSVKEVMGLLASWTAGDLYYASDFESETMASFNADSSGFTYTYNWDRNGNGTFESDEPTLVIDRIGHRRGAEEDRNEYALRIKNTLYQMFEMTNESSDWLGRAITDIHPDPELAAASNMNIFKGAGNYRSSILTCDDPGTDWQPFNVFANGNMISTYDASTRRFTYSEAPLASHTSDTPAGLDMSYHIGLSTLSMYNYLASDFNASTVDTYSSARSASAHVLKGHYKVNMIGSGFTQVVFFLNCFAFMFVAAIVGCVYSLGMVISVVKNGVRMLLSIPGAMMGLLKSIRNVIMIVVSMIIEVFVSILLYQGVSELMLILATLFETPIHEGLESIEATSILAMVHNVSGMAGGSSLAYMLYLMLVNVVFMCMGTVLLRKARSFHRLFNKVQVLLFARFAPDIETAQSYLRSGIDLGAGSVRQGIGIRRRLILAVDCFRQLWHGNICSE